MCLVYNFMISASRNRKYLSLATRDDASRLPLSHDFCEKGGPRDDGYPSKGQHSLQERGGTVLVAELHRAAGVAPGTAYGRSPFFEPRTAFASPASFPFPHQPW